MALICCPECGHAVSETAESCPYCGYPVAKSVAEDATIAESVQLGTMRATTSPRPPVSQLYAQPRKTGGAFATHTEPYITPGAMRYGYAASKQKRSVAPVVLGTIAFAGAMFLWPVGVLFGFLAVGIAESVKRNQGKIPGVGAGLFLGTVGVLLGLAVFVFGAAKAAGLLR